MCQRGQSRLARDDRDAELPRAHQLGMVGRDGRREDQRSGTDRMGRIVPASHLGAQRGDIRSPGRLRIAAADGHPPAAGNQGQGAHPRPANADEVHRPRIRGVE